MADTYPCGHPRTPENSKRGGTGWKCRACRRVIEARSQRKRRAGEVEGPAMMEDPLAPDAERG